MTKSAPPIPGQAALIDREDLPEGAVADRPAAVRLDWETAAEAAIIRFAKGRGLMAFQIHDAARAEQIEEPPDPSHDWGRLVQRLHREGVLSPAGAALSTRKRTASSLVHTWIAGPALKAGAR
jgi:hypothetical protein